MEKLLIIVSFIAIFTALFIAIYAIVLRGCNNAKNGYIFRHKYSPDRPYISPNELHYHVVELMDKALHDKKHVEGIEVKLIYSEQEQEPIKLKLWSVVLKIWRKFFGNKERK